MSDPGIFYRKDQGKRVFRRKTGTNCYPFGLTMAGISDKALKTQYVENKYRYNDGNELQNKEFSDGSGLETYDATFRMYDPQIGRFWQTDPLGIVTADYSPYSFALDNPILFNDPLGLLSDSTHPQELAAVTVTHAFNPLPTQHTAVTAGVADTKGGSPDVSGSAGPAPTSMAGQAAATTDQRTLFGVEIHFNALFKSGAMTAVDDFKFK